MDPAFDPISHPHIDIIDALLDTLDAETIRGIDHSFLYAVYAAKLDEALVLIQKQQAYGPNNIARPPSGITPETALLVRINDKLQRLGNLLSSDNDSPPGSEPRLDSWGDLSNYGTIGGLVDRGLWPGLDRGGAPHA